MLQVTTRRASTTPDIARHVKQDFGILVNIQIMRHTFDRRLKKPLLFDKNIKAWLEFVKVHKLWIIEIELFSQTSQK